LKLPGRPCSVTPGERKELPCLEVAAALPVSPKTIEPHLQSASREIGIRSFTQLALHVLSDEAA
jgi:hypothetical protein